MSVDFRGVRRTEYIKRMKTNLTEPYSYTALDLIVQKKVRKIWKNVWR